MKELTFKIDDFSNNFNLVDGNNVHLCGNGVTDLFIIPKSVNEIVMVFSKGKREGAYKISFDLDRDMEDIYERLGILNANDYEPALDGIRTPMYSNAETLLGTIWQEGYNYVRVEYNA